MTDLNVKLLKEASDRNPKYKAAFDMFAKRERGRQDSSTPRFRRMLKETVGVDMTPEEAMDFYRMLQKAGAGRWVSGRHGKPGRFLWGFHMKSVADAVLSADGTVGEIKPAPKAKVKLPKVGEERHKESPVIPSSEAARIIKVSAEGLSLEFPLNMTEQERKEAATFLATVTEEISQRKTS